MTVQISPEGKGYAMPITVTGVAAATAGGVGAILNSWGRDMIVLRTTLYVATPSTGAANLSVGVGATATTEATDVINALAMNGAITGKAYNGHAMQNTAKTEITAPILWARGKYLTFTGSASTVGLTGTLYVECLSV